MKNRCSCTYRVAANDGGIFITCGSVDFPIYHSINEIVTALDRNDNIGGFSIKMVLRNSPYKYNFVDELYTWIV